MRVIALFLLLLAPLAMAADNAPQTATDQPPAAAEEVLQPAPIETPAAPATDSELILADIEEDESADEDTLRNGRFIPTEEISQDLGVSFPVDI